MFIFCLLLNCAITLVTSSFGWLLEAFKFVSQTLPDHFLKNKDLEPYFRDAHSIITKIILNLDFFFFFFNQRSPTTPLQAILIQLILGPLIAQNSLRQVLDEI